MLGPHHFLLHPKQCLICSSSSTTSSSIPTASLSAEEEVSDLMLNDSNSSGQSTSTVISKLPGISLKDNMRMVMDRIRFNIGGMTIEMGRR